MNYIIGKVVYKGNNYVIIENNFIGYKVTVPSTINFEVEKYKKVFLYKKTIIQNNNLIEDVYGFETIKQRIFFDKLISVSGIGPKTAINILKNDLDIIKLAIVNQDVDTLSSMESISKKIAINLINNIEINEEISVDSTNTSSHKKNCRLDVVSTLQTLGYKKDKINEILKTNFTDDMFFIENDDQLTDLISKAIKELSMNISYEVE